MPKPPFHRTKQPSPPFAMFRLPAGWRDPTRDARTARRAERPVILQAIHQWGCLGFQGVASHRAGEVLGVDEIQRGSDAVQFGRLASADDRVRPFTARASDEAP